jgi:hypothetical protein
MSIHDFHSKFSSGERNTLFAALRRLSTMESPQRLAALADSAGWPVWDQASGSPPPVAFAHAGA